MPKKRRIWKSTGKREYLEDYYESHKKTIDNAVAVYKTRHPSSQSAKEIFVNRLYYGKDWNSAKRAKYEIDREIHLLRGGDSDEWEAKHTPNNRPSYYKSQTRVNKRFKSGYIEHDFEGEDSEGTFEIQGYYSLGKSSYVIAKVRRYFGEDSPFEAWEWKKKNEIGL